MEHKKHPELKWLILFSFSILVGVNQILWLTFSPIIISTQEFFAISEFKANLLTLIFPIVFVIFAIHSGKLIDEMGYKKVVTYAALLMLIGSGLRFLGLHNYWIVLAGQFLIAISQPYILNAINKIITDWFEPNLVHLATGIGIGILFFGTLAGALIPPILVKGLYFEGMLLVEFFITLMSFLFFISAIREKSKNKQGDVLTFKSILELLRNRRLLILSFLVFIAFGYFNGLTNWIAPLLEPKSLSEIHAGTFTAIFLLGGMFGSILIPILSNKVGKHQIFIVLALISSGLLTFLMFEVLSLNCMLIIAFVLGFILLGIYPIALIATHASVAPNDSAKSLALLELIGNLGGVAIVLLMELVKNYTGAWQSSVWVLIISMLVGLPLAFMLKDKR